MLETTDEAPSSTVSASLRGDLSLVICGARGPRAVPLRSNAPIHIGRASGCELILSEPSISRLHARFSRVDEGVLVEDLGSRHGTWVSGERVERAALGLGASVRLADVVITVARSAKLPESVHAQREAPEEAPIHAATRAPSPAESTTSSSLSTGGLRAQLKTVEHAQVKRALELSAGNQRRAAELVGLPLRTFERRLRALRQAEGQRDET